MRRALLAGIAVLAAAAVLVLHLTAAQAHPEAVETGWTVHLTIHHSRFRPDRVEVPAGATVMFVVDNTDPIGHELIVGDAGVHERHELGTEAEHQSRPGEVSIPPRTTAETTFTFGEPGSVLYACHLPGHFAYGMSGLVNVIPG